MGASGEVWLTWDNHRIGSGHQAVTETNWPQWPAGNTLAQSVSQSVSSLASPGEQEPGEAKSRGQAEVGEVCLGESSQEEAEEGGEARQTGGRPGQSVGGEEVGEAGQAGQGEDGPPVGARVLHSQPLTAT